MKIVIIGYGKIGKMIEETALEKGHTISLIVDIENYRDLTPANLAGNDVAIEFTIPSSAYNNISRCFDAQIPVVCGTTGWLEKFCQIRDRCINENQSFIYASNFSLGVNILFAVNRKLAGIMNRYDQYYPRIEEIHHIKKLDAPSGTAITLAEGLICEMSRVKNWKLTDHPDKLTVPVKAIRADNIPGIHEVTYESDFDLLSLKHSAKSRKGFALGAIMAAEFIHDKKGLFTMKDVLELG